MRKIEMLCIISVFCFDDLYKLNLLLAFQNFGFYWAKKSFIKLNLLLEIQNYNNYYFIGQGKSFIKLNLLLDFQNFRFY